MSQDRHDADSNEQVGETHASGVEPAAAPAVDNVPSTDADSQAGFEPVTIRSYLAEQFGVREVATPVQHAAPVASPTDANAELAKWRERVPKLASALRQRTEQIALLETQLEQAQTEAGKVSGSGAGLKARDEHIAALELKLVGLTTNYQNSEGNLRARDLELEDLRSDLQTSKQRWQNLTQALDTQVANTDEAQAQLAAAVERESLQQAKLDAQALELAAKEAALGEAQQALAQQLVTQDQLVAQLGEQSDVLQEAQERLIGLDDRNEKLLETTELANHQLESLSADLNRLQAELVSKEEAFAVKLAEQKQHSLLETAQIQAEHSERLRDIHAQTVLVFEAVERQNFEERQNDLAAQQASLELAMHSDYVELQQAAQGLLQQRAGLQSQLHHQQQSAAQAAAEYADAKQRDRNLHRQATADLTLALEAEIWVLQQQVQQLTQQLTQQQAPQEEQQPRVTLLGSISDANEDWDPRITLLGKISDGSKAEHSDFEQAWQGLNDHSVDSTNETIRELERLLKIRNDELSAALAARVHFLPAVTQPDSVTESIAGSPEQINLRAENERLREQLERTSAALLANDDLTQLKGVGAKMAEQLREFGISQFSQMAALDLAELEAPDHPLHNLASRIKRNGWIEQAKALVHPLTLYGER